jgi:hypothetical protein
MTAVGKRIQNSTAEICVLLEYYAALCCRRMQISSTTLGACLTTRIVPLFCVGGSTCLSIPNTKGKARTQISVFGAGNLWF